MFSRIAIVPSISPIISIAVNAPEHDETLLAHTPETIGMNELGNPGWDPVCFATNEAFKYYFPAMVRLVLNGKGDSYYADQFLLYIIEDGVRNRRWESFSNEQRKFVVCVMNELLDIRTEEIDEYYDTDDLFRAIEIWSDNGE